MAALLCATAFSQQLLTTYYDYYKSRPMEQYYVNSAGEKNGTYKHYDEHGIIDKEYSFLNGFENGLCTEYITMSGRRVLRSRCTYKQGVFNGPAVYYTAEGIPEQQGNFVNGKREGAWTVINLLQDEDNQHPKEGFKYAKGILEYRDGQIIDQTVKAYYYPSGKIFREFYMKDGKESGEQTSYYPDGKLQTRNKLDAAKKNFTTKESYYLSGKLESFEEYSETWRLTKEGYAVNLIIKEVRSEEGLIRTLETSEDWIDFDDQWKSTFEMGNGPFGDGWKTPEQKAAQFARNAVYFNSIKNICSKEPAFWIHIADSLSASHNNEQAYNTIYLAWIAYPTNGELAAKRKSLKAAHDQEAVKAAQVQADKDAAATVKQGDNYFDKGDYSNARSAYNNALKTSANNHAKGRIAEIDSIAGAEGNKKTELENQSSAVSGLYASFASSYATKKPIPFLVDETGKPLMKDSYPKGESLYKRSNVVIKQMMEEYETIADMETRLKMGTEISSILNKLNALNDSDAKELDKRMKKMKDNDEVKQALLQL